MPTKCVTLVIEQVDFQGINKESDTIQTQIIRVWLGIARRQIINLLIQNLVVSDLVRVTRVLLIIAAI